MATASPIPGGRRRIDRVLAPGYAAEPPQLDLDELRHRRDEAAQEETDLSYLRRLLHGRIDILLAEQRRRAEGVTSSLLENLSSALGVGAVGPATGSGRWQQLEPSRAEAHRRHVEAVVSDSELSDVGNLGDARVLEVLELYRQEEQSVSAQRHRVQDVMDALNAELGRRYRNGETTVDEVLDRARE